MGERSDLFSRLFKKIIKYFEEKSKMIKSKIIIGVLSIVVNILLVMGCSNSHKQVDKKNATAHDSAVSHEGEHIYACPMHTEIIGKAGDVCPKCGMKLEHNDNAVVLNSDKYKMKFVTNPAIIQTGKPVALAMTPQIIGKENELVPLDVVHEKKIHFIMVSKDLSWFDHQHPEYNASGSYDLNYTFKKAGDYMLFADYKPSGGNHTVDKIIVKVTGKVLPSKTYSQAQLNSKVDGFEVTLSSEDGKFESGSLQHIKGVISQGGKSVDPNTLENYLGAKAHMVVIGVEDKNYLHVHPGVENGNFDLHTTFDKPGIYRGWLQFQSAGQVHTADFVFKVEKGSSKVKDEMKSMKGM